MPSEPVHLAMFLRIQIPDTKHETHVAKPYKSMVKAARVSMGKQGSDVRTRYSLMIIQEIHVPG